MPGSVPFTSAIALTNVTLNYGLLIADKGVKGALLSDKGMIKGVNTYQGHCTNENLAASLNEKYVSIEELLIK